MATEADLGRPATSRGAWAADGGAEARRTPERSGRTGRHLLRDLASTLLLFLGHWLCALFSRPRTQTQRPPGSEEEGETEGTPGQQILQGPRGWGQLQRFQPEARGLGLCPSARQSWPPSGGVQPREKQARWGDRGDEGGTGDWHAGPEEPLGGRLKCPLQRG